MNLERAQKQRMLEALRVVSITSIVAVAVYYIPNYFLLEKVIAEHSAVLMGFIGIKASVWNMGDRVFVNQFEIERMCTGVQVIAVFLGIVVAIPKVALKKRALALAIVAVTIYFANIGRIAFEIWMLYNGILPWSLAHYPTGLILGVFAVAFLVVVADRFIPEIGDLAFSASNGFRKA